jgi:hypothetical protein
MHRREGVDSPARYHRDMRSRVKGNLRKLRGSKRSRRLRIHRQRWAFYRAYGYWWKPWKFYLGTVLWSDTESWLSAPEAPVAQR